MGIVKEYAQYISKYRKLADVKHRYFVFNFTTSLVNKVCILIYTFAASMLIEYLTKKNTEAALKSLAWFVAIYVLYMVAYYFNWVAYGASVKHIYHVLSTKIINKLFSVEYHFSKNIGKGRLISSINSDILKVSELNDSISEVITAFLQIAFALIVVCFQDVTVALILLIFTIIHLALRNWADRKVAYYDLKERNHSDNFSALINQILNGLKEVRSFNMLESLQKPLQKINIQYENSYSAKRRYSTIRDKDSRLLVYLFRFLLYIILIFLISQGQVGVGVLILAVAYHENIVSYIDKVVSRTAVVRIAVNCMDRINDIISYDTKQIEYGDVEAESLSGQIEFKHVSFSDNKKRVLHNINFKIKKNHAVAITGEEEAGKTTIFSLLLRLIYPDSGKITIDGENIFSFTPDSYSKSVTMADEKPFIFDMSIRSNFSLVDSNFKRQIEVCREVGVHDFITKLPHGYNTTLKENAKDIPIGQQQLISLARSILSGAHIILLDDITSNLDPDMIHKLPNIIENLKEKHTVVIITRNPEIMASVDQVIMLEKGKLIDQAPHKTLLRRCRSYKFLVDHYASGNKKEEEQDV